MTNQEYAHSLRLIADWYEAHPEFEAPYGDFSVCNLNGKDTAAALVRALGGCEKEYSENMFFIKKSFAGLKISFAFYRNDVCERVVVGEEDVPEKIIPAQKREIVEWRCAPILAASDEARKQGAEEYNEGRT